VKGSLDDLCLGKRYDYGEIGTMVEKRDIPGDWRGHWRFARRTLMPACCPPTQGELSLPAW